MLKGKLVKISHYSSILNKNISLLIYLPLIKENTALPVLYFLHGRNGDENILTEVHLDTIADQMISEGKINPMIIVCPGIGNSRGMNSSLTTDEVLNSVNRLYHTGRYEDYLIQELVPYIDRSYNTINERKGRFIGGVSAGGFAALHNAFKHPDLFSKIGGHMPAIDLFYNDEDEPHFTNNETWEKCDPIRLAATLNYGTDIKVYLDAGDQDEGGFYEGCAILHKTLGSKGIASENHLFSGHHDAEYVKSNIEKYLAFYGK